MDLLENIASELGFEFHLYIVRDELFGTKFRNLKDWIQKMGNSGSSPSSSSNNNNDNAGSNVGSNGNVPIDYVVSTASPSLMTLASTTGYGRHRHNMDSSNDGKISYPIIYFLYSNKIYSEISFS